MSSKIEFSHGHWQLWAFIELQYDSTVMIFSACINGVTLFYVFRTTLMFLFLASNICDIRKPTRSWRQCRTQCCCRRARSCLDSWPPSRGYRSKGAFIEISRRILLTCVLDIASDPSLRPCQRTEKQPVIVKYCYALSTLSVLTMCQRVHHPVKM